MDLSRARLVKNNRPDAKLRCLVCGRPFGVGDPKWTYTTTMKKKTVISHWCTVCNRDRDTVETFIRCKNKAGEGRPPISKCCGAPVRIDGCTTLYFVCLNCGKPCDVKSAVKE